MVSSPRASLKGLGIEQPPTQEAYEHVSEGGERGRCCRTVAKLVVKSDTSRNPTGYSPNEGPIKHSLGGRTKRPPMHSPSKSLRLRSRKSRCSSSSSSRGMVPTSNDRNKRRGYHCTTSKRTTVRRRDILKTILLRSGGVRVHCSDWPQ